MTIGWFIAFFAVLFLVHLALIFIIRWLFFSGGGLFVTRAEFSLAITELELSIGEIKSMTTSVAEAHGKMMGDIAQKLERLIGFEEGRKA